MRYTYDLTDSQSLTFAVNSAWHSDKFLREFNELDVDRVAPNSKTDASVTYALEELGLTIIGYVNNIENNIEKNTVISGRRSSRAVRSPRLRCARR